jgi:hypothetical protein
MSVSSLLGDNGVIRYSYEERLPPDWNPTIRSHETRVMSYGRGGDYSNDDDDDNVDYIEYNDVRGALEDKLIKSGYTRLSLTAISEVWVKRGYKGRVITAFERRLCWCLLGLVVVLIITVVITASSSAGRQ